MTLRARFVAGASMLSVGVACSTPPPTTDASVPQPSGTAVSPPPATATAGPSAAASASAKAAAPPPAPTATASAKAAVPPPAAGPLAHFYGALRDLAGGKRKDHVRVVWLGDSHAQADFWSGHIRSGLQKRFGNGGPGFVHIGMKQYRHGGTKIEIKGKWRMRPKMPSTITPWADGTHGLGGILHAGFAGMRRASVILRDPAWKGRTMNVDLCFKMSSKQDEFRLHLGKPKPELIKADGPIKKLVHIARTVPGDGIVTVAPRSGRPDFCGLVVETKPADGPGVVLDNLGINGARYATFLAWNEAAWVAELARRPPELFVLEFGGNEASDPVSKPDEYKKNLKALAARVRKGAPNASCLVVGVADRADREARIPPIVAAQKAGAAEAGCMFWNTYEVMGGKGSLRKWRDDGRASEDGVHLKPKGYAEIGALLLADMMRGYRP